MGEKSSVAKGESLTYEGIFKLKGFMDTLKKWLEEKGYGWIETSHTESLTPEGKHIEVEMKCNKSVSDYAKKELKLALVFDKIKEKVIEKASKKQRFHIGTVSVTIDAAMLTDYSERWKEDKPAFYLIRQFFEKYIYSSYGSKIKNEVREDVDHLKDHLSSFLNLYKY